MLDKQKKKLLLLTMLFFVISGLSIIKYAQRITYTTSLYNDLYMNHGYDMVPTLYSPVSMFLTCIVAIVIVVTLIMIISKKIKIETKNIWISIFLIVEIFILPIIFLYCPSNMAH